jgi:hypothetical protein
MNPKVTKVPRIRVTYNKRGFRNSKQFSNAILAAEWYALCAFSDGLQTRIWSKIPNSAGPERYAKYQSCMERMTRRLIPIFQKHLENA